MKISIVGFGRMGFKHYQACKLLNFDIVNVIESNKKNLNLAIQKINNKNYKWNTEDKYFF